MATRTIAHWKDRLATIMVAPLMTCSARLPVYALLIGAFVPDGRVGPFNLRGLTLFVLYVAGVVSAMAVAWVLKRTWSKRPLPAAHARAAAVSHAEPAQPRPRPVGARVDLPAPRRRDHLHADGRALVPVELPGAAAGATGRRSSTASPE
jgi:hypothetical protein